MSDVERRSCTACGITFNVADLGPAFCSVCSAPISLANVHIVPIPNEYLRETHSRFNHTHRIACTACVPRSLAKWMHSVLVQ